MSLGRPPDARETSRPRPSGVTAGDVPETSSAGGHRLSDGCGTSPRRPSPADAPGTSPTVQTDLTLGLQSGKGNGQLGSLGMLTALQVLTITRGQHHPENPHRDLSGEKAYLEATKIDLSVFL